MKTSQVWVNFITIVLLLGLVGLSVVQLNITLAMQETMEQVASDTKYITRKITEHDGWGQQSYLPGI